MELNDNNNQLLQDTLGNAILIYFRHPCDNDGCRVPPGITFQGQLSVSFAKEVKILAECMACEKKCDIEVLYNKTWNDCYLLKRKCSYCGKECKFRFVVCCINCKKILCFLRNHGTKEEYWKSIFACYTNDTRLPMTYGVRSTNQLYQRVPEDAKTLMKHMDDTDTTNLHVYGTTVKEEIDYIWNRFDHSFREGRINKIFNNKVAEYEKKGGNRKNVYIRIEIKTFEHWGKAGVLEVWPAGNKSLRHIHAGCAGGIRVLRGKLIMEIFKDLTSPNELKREVFDVGDVTWLTRNHFYTHTVQADSKTCEDKNIAVCASYHIYKNCEDEGFAFTSNNKDLTVAIPKNDINTQDWIKMREDWIKEYHKRFRY